ncbi:hypothetical protein [Spongorhabdus nitratireducens]
MEETITLALFALLPITLIELTNVRRKLQRTESKLNLLLQRHGLDHHEETVIPEEVEQALQAGRKIRAIRLYRQHTGASLREAHEIVTTFVRGK